MSVLGVFDRAHKLLGNESLVGVRGGRRCDALDLARIDIYVSGLDRRLFGGL